MNWCGIINSVFALNHLYGSYHNLTNYVEYTPGNCDVIISAPHGGMELDPRIQTREPGCYYNGKCDWSYNCFPKSPEHCPVVTIGDLYTIETAKLISEELEKQSGMKPHLIVNKLSRRQMDGNRARDEGTAGNPVAEMVWDDFQAYINQSTCLVNNGLYLDIHGHGHPEGNVELGYRITKRQLNSGQFTGYKSTVRYAVERTGLNLITGSFSFGNLLSEQGFDTVPSPRLPKPGQGKYFDGGYNVLTHGSLKEGSVDGIQIEIPKHLRWVEQKRAEFSKAVARAIADFLRIRRGDTERRGGEEEEEEGEDYDELDDPFSSWYWD